MRAVTRDGDVLGARWSAGGSSSAPSAIEIRAAVDEAQLKADEAAARHERLHAQLTEARARADALKADVDAALLALHESDAKLSAVAEQLAQLGQAARSASAEADRLDAARANAEEARDRDLAGLSELEERLHLAEARPTIPRSRSPTSATRCRPRSPGPGRRRWRRGSRFAPARSGCGLLPGAPTSCCAPRRSSAPPADG